ncbi:VWA domain-containing protein [Flavivirga aquimarina]|uniref:VWA domain-containing protein n=1 Tax=Flavivirga aquimarina TaxID=2027862 RepID=A0ABT8WB99_9FLAO|nr:vWA domain-containing protein [Flavivirga aquimarina]MDO5970302.1 VWA domain-containing protein [Flavivirga aquimarina]
MKNVFSKLKTFFSSLIEAVFGNGLSEIDKLTAPLNEYVEQAKEDAETAGLKGEENIDGIINPVVEKIDAAKDEALGAIDADGTKIKEKQSRVEKELNVPDDKRVEREKNKLQPDVNRKCTKEYATYTEAHRGKDEAVISLQSVKVSLSKYSGIYKKAFFQTLAVTLVIASMIMGLEVGYFTPILEAHGFNYGQALLGATGFSCLLIFFAEMTGYYYRSGSKKGFLVFCFFGLGFLTFIIGLRISVNSEHWQFTAPAIALLYSTSTLAATARYKSKAWFDQLALKASLIKQINKFNKTMLDATANANIIVAQWHQKAEANAAAEKNRLINEAISLEAALTTNEQKKPTTVNGFEHYKKQAVGEIKKSHQEGRSRHYSGDDTQAPPPFPEWKNPVFVILLMLSLSFFTACENANIQQDNLYGIILADGSGSYGGNQFVSQNVCEALITQLGTDNPGTNGFKGRIEYSVFGDSIMPKIGVIPIPEVPHLLNRNREKTKRDLKQFDDDLKFKLEAFFGSIKGEGSTQLYHNLSYTLGRMARSSANRTILFLLTDGVEESHILSMVDLHNKDPKALTKDYDLIKEMFLDVAKIPDLSGIEIKIIGTDDGTSDLPFQCRNFWKRFLEEFSADVEILPNL